MSDGNCPHCGGQSGSITTIVMSARRGYSWSGEVQDTDSYNVKSETIPACQDCGKRVPWATIQKAPNDQ